MAGFWIVAPQEKAFEVLDSNFAKEAINSVDSWAKTSFKRLAVQQGETKGPVYCIRSTIWHTANHNLFITHNE